MNIIVIKTGIDDFSQVSRLRFVLAAVQQIKAWYLDIDDVDHVLRVDTEGYLTEEQLIELLRRYDIPCDYLPDEVPA